MKLLFNKISIKPYLLIIIGMFLLLLFNQFSVINDISWLLHLLKFLAILLFLALLWTLKIKPRYLLAVLLLTACYFLYQLIPLIYTSVSYANIVPLSTTLASLVDSTFRFFYVFSFLALIAPLTKEKADFEFFINLVLVIVYLTIFYSLIFEWQNLIMSFKEDSSHFYQLKSIFTNKNTFGLFLYTGFILSIYQIVKGKPLYFISAIIMIIYLFIIHSKTPLGIAILLLLICYGKFLFTSKSRKTHKLAIILTFSILLSVGVIFTILYVSNVHFAVRIVKFIENNIFSDGLVTIKERLNYIKQFFHVIDIFAIIFGYGLLTSEKVLFSLMERKLIDSQYFFAIQVGGIILLIFVILVFVYLLCRIKFNENRWFIYLLLGANAIYGLFESTSFVNVTCYALPIYLIMLLNIEPKAHDDGIYCLNSINNENILEINYQELSPFKQYKDTLIISKNDHLNIKLLLTLLFSPFKNIVYYGEPSKLRNFFTRYLSYFIFDAYIDSGKKESPFIKQYSSLNEYLDYKK